MDTVPTSRKSNSLLFKYLAQLSLHPLRTKALTTATLCFLQEVLGSRIAGTRPKVSKNAPPLVRSLAAAYIDAKAFKLALYGFLVSAPLSHYLVGALQNAFKGRTSFRDKILQIIASNLLISPIQVSAFLASTAIINGASSAKEVIRAVKAGFFTVIRISWIISPVSIAVAQKFIPVELWVPFFNLVQFMLGTYFNVRVKALRNGTAKKGKDRESERED